MESCPFSERFLQIIWNERLVSAQAKCIDGRAVHALSVGLWNRMAGPDFHDAAVVVGGELLRGDVEVHRTSSEWRAHRHDGDARYANVILHVVWEDDGGGPAIPTLELREQLQSSWRKLFREVKEAFYPYAREVPPGACALRWALTEDARLREILASAGFARLQRRGQRLLRLASRTGEDQALYEQVFEGLGYAANREPFRRLAQALPVESLAGEDIGGLAGEKRLLALFFGSAGLLPDLTQEEVLPEMAEFVGQAWQTWWQSGRPVLELAWNPAGSRPFNSVERRLAGGVAWLRQCGARPAQWLEETVRKAGDDPRALLRAFLCAPRLEGPWAEVRDFGTRLSKPAALLGRERLMDLVLNTFLPFLIAKAEVEGREAIWELVRQAWALLPRCQENRLLRDASRRFLTPPSRASVLLRHASQQQGMMDIFQNFCLALDNACTECPFVVSPEIPQ